MFDRLFARIDFFIEIERYCQVEQSSNLSSLVSNLAAEM
jgi:hypothetical protein